MKLPSTLFWRRLVVLMLFLLGSSALLAQDEPIEQTPQDLSLLFKGYLNEGARTKTTTSSSATPSMQEIKLSPRFSVS